MSAVAPVALLLSGCDDAAPTETETADAATPADAAPAAAPTADEAKAGAEAAIRAIYASYSSDDSASIPTAWERPVFSRNLAALVATIPHPTDEVGPLDDADWFCGCQDWDAATAAVKSLTATPLPDGKVSVVSSFSAMADAEPTNITFTMVNEGGRWLIDDMQTTGMPGTLRADIAAAVRDAGGAH